MSEITATIDQTFQCKFCQRRFQREATLLVHVCEQKRRSQERDEVGVNLGLQAYLKFYQVTQGSSRLKTWDDFSTSPYYRAFVKFGRYCQSTRVINIPRFVDWLLKHNKKLDHWCRDSIYGEYLLDYTRVEDASDAMVRAIERSVAWAHDTGNPAHDYLRYGNRNALCHDITTGRVTPWVLYNCDSGVEFLSDLNTEQIAMTWPWIDSEFWQRRFADYPADVEYTKAMLAQAGW